jgi:hypothetical protein
VRVLDHIRQHALQVAGVDPPMAWDDVKRRNRIPAEWLTLLQNRLIAGFFRYGVHIDERRPSDYDQVRAAIYHLQTYLADPNIEHLVDAANLCLVEFQRPSREGTYWNSVDDGTHSALL